MAKGGFYEKDTFLGTRWISCDFAYNLSFRGVNLIVQVCDILRVECVPQCNAMCAGFVFKIMRRFSDVLLLNMVPFWLLPCVVLMPCVYHLSQPGSIGVLLVYSLKPFSYEYFKIVLQ